MSFNEISSFDGLAGLNQLRHLDLGYNIIEGVLRYYGAVSPQATDSGSIEHSPSLMSKETLRSGVLDAEPAVVVAAARREARVGGGRKEDRREKECTSPAAAEIELPCLTRLDLNNNILHNLDDLKAREGQWL